ncbi:MAG: hypothetical protein ACKOXK_08580 [Chakrabartia sp.]
MKKQQFNYTLWDACRFFNFFWLWASPAYWLISDQIQHGEARRAAGLGAPYLFFTIILISLLSGSYFLIKLRPKIAESKQNYNTPYSVVRGNFNLNVMIGIAIALFRAYGGFVCFITTTCSGFVLHYLTYPIEIVDQVRFPLSEDVHFILCVALFTNGGYVSLIYCTNNAEND